MYITYLYVLYKNSKIQFGFQTTEALLCSLNSVLKFRKVPKTRLDPDFREIASIAVK